MKSTAWQSRSAALGICLAVVVAIPSHAAYVYIDTFTSNQTVTLSGGGPGFAFGFTNAAGVALGNEREILIVRTNSPIGGDVVGQVMFGSLTNGVTYSANPGAFGNMAIIYDGSDGSINTNFAGLGSFDLTDNGLNDRFQIRGGADTANGSFTITVFSSAANYSRQTLSVPGGTGTQATFTNFFFAFADMVDFGSGADFADVNAIVFEMNGLGQAGIDMGINLFVAIPEPIAWWPLAGLAATVLFRRRLVRK